MAFSILEENVANCKKETTDDSEEDSGILEESPCKRWLKRKEIIKQCNIPGTDVSYLAMDVEDGVEVVWNEVKFSEKKVFKFRKRKIKAIFDSLILIDHPNIVKFHTYWIDKKQLRVIFITEYVSSGSLKQFLKKTKRNVIKLPFNSWKRWCTQILSALNYLHSCYHPIVHGNLTCDTIFIQHNGLIKIGSIALDAIHDKTYKRGVTNSHFLAPECCEMSLTVPVIDIYAFGICALEMAALEICGSDSGHPVTENMINKTIDSLESRLQRDFIKKCLQKSSFRPTAHQLLFHPVIFEVHSLKLLAAHTVIKFMSLFSSEQLTNEAIDSGRNSCDILAYVSSHNEKIGSSISRANAPKLDFEKLLDDVRNGSYPLTAFSTPSFVSLMNEKVYSPSAKQFLGSYEAESRKIINMMCNIKPSEESDKIRMTILLRMDDQMNRQLTCEITAADTSSKLVGELVTLGFINEADSNMAAALIEDTLSLHDSF